MSNFVSSGEVKTADREKMGGSISANLLYVKLGFVGIYLFDAGESLIAFDTGMNSKATFAALEKLRVDP